MVGNHDTIRNGRHYQSTNVHLSAIGRIAISKYGWDAEYDTGCRKSVSIINTVILIMHSAVFPYDLYRVTTP